MADVSPPPVPGSDASRVAPRGSDRGQLFLVGALALSVILVTLAVLLNTAIYTGNVATRDPGTGSADVIEYRAAANEMAENTLTGVNSENHADYGALESDFQAAVDAWSVASTKHSAVKGTDAHVSKINSPTMGTRIVQDTNRAFTNADNTPDWTLATDVQVRKFMLSVDQSSVLQISEDDTTDDFSETFTLSITDSNDKVWEVHIYDLDDGPAELRVAVVDPTGGISRCSIETTGSTTIDLTNARLAGDQCGALDFWSSSSPKFTIEYSNGDAAQGTYSLVVDKERSSFGTPEYNTDGSTSPYITRALYSAEVEVVYRSPTVDYRTQFRVAPGEYDE